MSRWKKEIENTDFTRQSEPIRGQRVGRTESFASNHVKLITFLVCIGVFLVVFGPIFVLEGQDYLGPREDDNRPQMTLNDLILLSEQDGKISQSQIEKFASTKDEKDYEIYYYINIEPNYTLLAVSDKTSRMLVYCQLANLDTGEDVDVLTEDVRAFLQKN